MEIIQSWPVVTRTLVVSTLALSVLIHTHLLSYYPFYLSFPHILRLPPKIPEIWRLYTAFCVTGEGLSIFFDAYFLYTYSSALEQNSPRFTEIGSFFIYTVFIMVGVTATAGFYLGAFLLLQPLVLAFAYTFSQDNPNSNVTFYIITFPAKYLPYALIFVTFLTSGPHAAKVQITGLLTAHLYDFLTRIWPQYGGGRNYIVTPNFVKRWFGGPAAPQVRGYGTAFRPREDVPPAGGAGTGAWTGQRGPGRRLGGE